MSTIGENIAAFRKEKKLTQEELAEKMSVTPQAVSKWECDSSYPDVIVMQQLAQILGVTVNDILNGKQELPTFLQAELETIDKRILYIEVTTGDTVIKTRFPVSMIRTLLENGLLAKILGFANDYDDDDVDDKTELDNTLRLIRSFVEEGVVGPIMQIDNDDTHVSIEVLYHEN